MRSTALTSDRFNSGSPAWSADGQWLYFLSDRNLKTTVHGPWGSRQPDPHFDRTMKIYQLALKKGLRSPFEPADELHPGGQAGGEEGGDQAGRDQARHRNQAGGRKTADKDKDKPRRRARKPVKVKVEIELDGIMARISETPAPPGNYEDLSASAKRLCWMAGSGNSAAAAGAECMDIDNKGEKPETVMADVRGYELSQDGKKLLCARSRISTSSTPG